MLPFRLPGWIGQVFQVGFDLRNRKESRAVSGVDDRSEEHTSELQSPCNLVCRLLLEKKKTQTVVFSRSRLGYRVPALPPARPTRSCCGHPRPRRLPLPCLPVDTPPFRPRLPDVVYHC